MTDLDLIRSITITSPARMVMLVMDGLGGLPNPSTGKTELESARKPNLDRLAAEGTCGLTIPVDHGITAGSGAGHLALFGYDPVKYNIGRGVLEAVGIDFDLKPGDMAARGNFATIDAAGLVTDRRAGRISTERCADLCRLLDGMTIGETRAMVRPVKEHRFVVVLRGGKLSSEVADTDPERTGVAPLATKATAPAGEATAAVVNQFIARARDLLAEHPPANMVLLRGFSQHPSWPPMTEVYRLKPAAVAAYPMYRGVARLVGMEVLPTGSTVDDEMATLRERFADFDFFFVHVKGADAAGEDGDFDRKVRVIEEVDRALPVLLSLKPDVIVVAGDHSTPAAIKGHSWHPVPALVWSKWCRPDGVKEFGESACLNGGLGLIPATSLMTLAMANALKLTKFGA